MAEYAYSKRPLWFKWLACDERRWANALGLASFMPKDKRGWVGLVEDLEAAAAALHARALYIRSARRGCFTEER